MVCALGFSIIVWRRAGFIWDMNLWARHIHVTIPSLAGARPTNDISIEFEIRPKFGVLQFTIYVTDHNQILQTSRQCKSMHVKSQPCKFWSNFEFDRNIVSGPGATGSHKRARPVTCHSETQWHPSCCYILGRILYVVYHSKRCSWVHIHVPLNVFMCVQLLWYCAEKLLTPIYSLSYVSLFIET